MKTLTETLAVAQRRASGLPAISVEVRTYGHPQKAGGSGGAAADGLFPGLFNWTKLYEDELSPDYHGLAIPSDGSLNRIRNAPGIYHQRVASPSPESDFGAAWTLIMNNVDGPCTITALAANVMVAAPRSSDGVAQYCLSTNYGASFGEPVAITDSARACTRAVALAHKANGVCALAGVETGSNNLWIRFYYDGYFHSPYDYTSPPEIWGLAMYYDGDWNIIALLNVNSEYRLARFVFGDGYRVSSGYWSGYEYLDLCRATTDAYKLILQYYDRPREERPVLPQPPLAYNKWGWGKYQYPRTYRNYINNLHSTGMIQPRDPRENWAQVSAILGAREIDNLGLDAPFICKPSGGPPILSVYKQNDKWQFRLRPSTDFYDSDWYKSYRLPGSCTYGLAVACDSNYIWGTRACEVWRSPLPGSCWVTPTAGAGAGDTPVTIPQADIRSARETIRPMSRSQLQLVLDNAAGQYADLPTSVIKKGSRIAFACGYRTASGETADPNYYFIEDWTYDRAPNLATVTVNCIDAWGLLDQYVIPGYQEYNFSSNTHTVYDIISKLMQCIGGTLSYKSRSSDITSLYPRLSIQAGEPGASLLRRLLDMVPDVIYFIGLDAYIVYPQTTDSPVYAYHFPGGA